MSGKQKKKSWFKDNLQTWVTVGTVLIGLINLSILVQLAPLAEGLHLLAQRVSAIEEDRSQTKPYIERFVKVESIIPAIENDVKEIKDDVKFIRNFYSQP